MLENVKPGNVLLCKADLHLKLKESFGLMLKV